jgi:predicted SAM-dependent methyltransferase
VAVRRLRRFQAPYKLHVGCGSVRFRGWINIDQYDNGGVVDLAWNVTDPLPLPNESCRLIYSEHFLEHLSVEQGVAFLAHCHRLLRRGGILRVAMPSLEAAVQHYQAGTWRDQAWLQLPENQSIQTGAEMLNVFFRSWGHQWIYDRAELHRRLAEAGFSRWRDCVPNASDEPELRSRETRPDSLLVCEGIRQ